jgi:multidrug resistance efflux pump
VEIARLQTELEQNTARDQARVQYDNAVSEWKSVLQRLGNLHITARHDGTVLSVAPVRGEWIHSGAAIAQLADLSMLSMEVPVNGTVARLVKPGEMVLVRLPTDPPREVEAPVNSVLLQRGDGEYSYVVQVKLPNPDPGTILAGLEGAVVFRHVLKGGM